MPAAPAVSLARGSRGDTEAGRRAAAASAVLLLSRPACRRRQLAEESPPTPPEEVPERERGPPSLPRAPPLEPAPVETPAPMALVTTKPAPGADTGSQSGSYWWIWVLGAVVLAGAGAGTYFALKQGGTDIPPSTLGNYKF